MPELPEVETVRRTLEDRVLGCAVTGVVVRRREVIATPADPPGGFGRQRGGSTRRPKRVAKPDLLVGQRIESVRRHGKQLALVGDAGSVVLIHLGMTGEVMAPGPGGRLRAADHCHVLWTLGRVQDGAGRVRGGRMVFRDPRRFGGLWTLATPAELDDRWRALGPDGLLVTGDDLADRLGGSARAVKAGLLDQRAVAGVGNIYADEALHRAGLRPDRVCRDVLPGEWAGLAGSVRAILARAVELRGSTIRDYRDAAGRPGSAGLEHRVYGRGGQPCVACGRPLRSAGVAQRTTVWCDGCQR